MMRRAVAGLLFFTGSHLIRSQEEEESCPSSNDDGQCVVSSIDDKCTVYLAPSSIPGAGLGIFTAVDRQEGDIVGHGDVILPISDFAYHMSADYKFNGNHHFDPTANYVWDGREMALQYETALVHEGVAAFCPGFHCGINCHLGLLNVDKSPPVYDTAGLHRQRDPGAGAFTPYHNSSAVITAPVPAGGELFENYGDEYFTSRRTLELVPIWEDYPQAEEFVGLFNKLWDDHFAHLSPQIMADLWTLVYEFPLRSRFFNALPKNMEEMETVLLEGIRAILQPHFTRPVLYLESNGRCLDNIWGQPSTLPQAGRGAFATRPLVKGQIVTGSPVLWYPNGDYFKMYDGNWTSQHEPPNLENQTHSQILINYCWTHPQSSLFLCPYGSGVQYINHNKSQANIVVQWAKDGEMGHEEKWLSDSPEKMFPIANPGLCLDFVATRDIAAGEELFMDYGSAWEAAWQSHVQQWNAHQEQQQKQQFNYQSAREWNLQNADAPLRTVEEQKTNPYPDNFMFRCLKEAGVYELTSDMASQLWDVRTVGLPCSIQQRTTTTDGSDTYTVHFLPDSDYESDLEELGLGPNEDGELWWMETDGVPREAIKVLDTPYTTDLFLKEAFRHPIGIPDHLFPKSWKGYETSGIW